MFGYWWCLNCRCLLNRYASPCDDYLGILCFLRSGNRGPSLWVCDPSTWVEVLHVGNLDGSGSNHASSVIIA